MVRTPDTEAGGRLPGAAGGAQGKEHSSRGIEFHFCKIKKSGNRLHSNVNALNTTHKIVSCGKFYVICFFNYDENFFF